MRSRKALINVISSIVYELTTVICGFVLPRLILTSFGSSYNGVTSSITQFLGYISLMRAGIGGVTRAALYKPLADNDTEGISGVINATENFLRKVALLFSITILVLAAVYPFFVIEDFDWFFTFTLVLILGISTFAQYFLGFTYQLLLQADQRQGVIFFIQTISTIANTIVAAVLINMGMGIHGVKLGSASVYVLSMLAINRFTRHFYKIDKTVPPNEEAIKDRWDCFGLQVANFITNNTDMVVLTVFTNVNEVSVYTVYYMVTHGIRRVLLTFVNSIGAAFGSMFANGEEENARRNFALYEQLVFFLSNFLFSITCVMILDFVRIYTHGITDVEYERPLFAIVLIVATLFGAYRIPYQSIVEVVGHFKQTRNGSFFEAFLNIAVSIVCVNLFGLVGVAVGTLVATVFRTFQYSIYMSKYLIKRSMWPVLKRLILSIATFAAVIVLVWALHFDTPNTYLEWAITAIPVSCIAFAVCLAVELVFYRSDLWLTITKLKHAITPKKKKVEKGTEVQ